MYEQYVKVDPYTKEKYPQSIYHSSKNLKWVGNPTIRRADAPLKVTGKAQFGNDKLLPNMLYLKLKTCPYSHAKVKSIDTSKAKALPGVAMVLTNADVPNLMAAAPYIYCLQKECWLSGDAVAAVAAVDEDIAEEACALITVEYDVLPFVLHQEDAMKANAPRLHGDTNEVGTPFTFKRGDIEKGFSQADKVVEKTYSSTTKPYRGTRPVAPLEQESMTCLWDGYRLLCWSGTQGPHNDQRMIAAQIGVPYNRVVVYDTCMGTGFGLKGNCSRQKILAGYISKMTGKPVKTYQDTDVYFNTQTSSQTGQTHTLKAGLKSDGTLVALSAINHMNAGWAGSRGAQSGTYHISTRVTVPNLYLECHDYWTNSQSAGVPRCVHDPVPTYATGLFFDECAEALNMDPADFLVKNVFKGSGVGTHQDSPEWDLGANPNPEMLTKMIARSGWKNKWKGWKTPMSVSGNKARGIGIALHNCSHGLLTNPMSAMIFSNTDGTFQINCGSMDIGTGWRTAAAIMAAEELGVDFKEVFHGAYNTDDTQESMMTGGSRVVRNSGTALILACRDLKAQLFDMAIAAKLIAATSRDELETADSNIYLKSDPTKKVPIKNVVALQSGTYVDSSGGTFYGGPLIGRGSYATKRTGPMQQMQWTSLIAEVEVNTDTGEVKPLVMWGEQGIGRVIYERGMHNQYWGGILLSQGHALYEGLIKDEPTGITLNPDYMNFRIPSMADVPKMEIEFVEEIDPYGPFGAKGASEMQTAVPAPAISNAIYNACGARVRSLMITPDRVLEAMGKV